MILLELLAEKDGGEGTDIREGGGVDELGELNSKSIGVVISDEVEDRFSVGPLVVLGGHKVGD